MTLVLALGVQWAQLVLGLQEDEHTRKMGELKR
jgi:hypothetical protein